MVKTLFFRLSWTFDTMTYMVEKCQDDVTYVKMFLPSLVTEIMGQFFVFGTSEKLQGKIDMYMY